MTEQGNQATEQCTACDDMWEPSFFCAKCSMPYEEFVDDWALDPMHELNPRGDVYGPGMETIYPHVCMNCCMCHMANVQPRKMPEVPSDEEIPF